MEIVIIVLLFLILGCVGFIIVIQHLFVSRQAEMLEESLDNDANTTAYLRSLENSLTSAHKDVMLLSRERSMLVEMMQVVWQSRDTDAAATAIRNLVSVTPEGIQYNVEECYTQLREDLGIG